MLIGHILLKDTLCNF